MDFPCGVTVLVLSSSFTCFTVNTVAVAEEDCFRTSDDFQGLEFDNPCAGESGQPAKLVYCSKGRKSKGYCSTECEYCDPDGTTYQSGFTNCTFCLPCKTKAKCPPGQVIVKNCTIEEDAVCGCPAPPACPTCESCQTVTQTPSALTLSKLPDCPPREYPTNTSGYLVGQNFASCQQCWIPLILLIALCVLTVLGVIILRRWLILTKRTVRRTASKTANLEGQEDSAKPGTSAKDKPKDDIKGAKKGGEPFDDTDNSEKMKLLAVANGKDETVEKLQQDLKEKNEEIKKLLQAQIANENQNKELEDKVKQLEEKLIKLEAEKEAENKSLENQLVEKDGKKDLRKDEEMQENQGSKSFSSHTLPRVSSPQIQDRKPDEDKMMFTTFRFLQHSLSKEWREIGTHLGLFDSTLNQIESDNKGHLGETIYQVFCHWKQNNGTDATYANLIKALLAANRKDLADKVQNRNDLK